MYYVMEIERRLFNRLNNKEENTNPSLGIELQYKYLTHGC